MRLMYEPKTSEGHIAPYRHSELNLTVHSEDAGELVRDLGERNNHYGDRANDRGHFHDSYLAHSTYSALND